MEPVAQPPLAQPPAPDVDEPRSGNSSRRSFLRLALTVGAALAGGAGFLSLTRQRPGSTAAPAEPLPPATTVLAPPPADPPLVTSGLYPWITPNDEFFRIDIASSVPQVDAGTWRLVVDGLVGEPLSLSYDDVRALDLVEVDMTLSCVSNPIGGHEIGNARWTGVRLRDVLSLAHYDAAAEQVFTYGDDGFTAGFPLAAALQQDALIAIGMNGEPLPVEHGYPARLVVPGLYGYVSATKWLNRIELATWAERSGFWIPRGWSRLGPVKPGSRIDIPRQGADVTAGSVDVAGVAWCAGGVVTRVEVRVGDGPWQDATLGSAPSDLSWRQWWTTVDMSSGRAEITVRAYDAQGRMQTADVADVAPDGATGWHSVFVDVA